MEQWKVSDIEDNSVHPHDIYCKKTIKYPACFNIDVNLTKVEPAPVTLPFSHMWDGYCPYDFIDEICFNDFDELKQKFKKATTLNDWIVQLLKRYKICKNIALKSNKKA